MTYFDQNQFLFLNKGIHLQIPSHIKVDLNDTLEGGFIFDKNNGTMYTLNSPAAFIFCKLLNGESTHTLESVTQDLTKEYDVSNSQAQDDLIEFLCCLQDLSIKVFNEKKN
ncbi:MAG: PqqD family protein [Deltaproteobacteria bacterium]|nr:PqqD family protein [Deltaproteobacteria bacterium]